MRTFFHKQRAAAAMTGLFVFIFISYLILTTESLGFDSIVRESIYSFRNETLTNILRAITYMGNWQTVTLICCVLLLLPGTRFSVGLPASLTAVLCSVIQKALKVSFHRARPDITLHLIEQGGYSFPSGHSFTVLTFYGLLIFILRQKSKNKAVANTATILLSLLIFLIGFSRIYLGVHYPTDVLGGWALGICFLMFLISGIIYLQRDKTSD